MGKAQIFGQCFWQVKLFDGIHDGSLFLRNSEASPDGCSADILQRVGLTAFLQQLENQFFVVPMVLLRDQIFQQVMILRLKPVSSIQEAVDQNVGVFADTTRVAFDILHNVMNLVFFGVEAVLQQHARNVQPGILDS